MSRLLAEHAEPTAARVIRHKAGGARAHSRRADEVARAEDVRDYSASRPETVTKFLSAIIAGRDFARRPENRAAVLGHIAA